MTYWIAYYTDWSGFAIFDTELSALRYAVKHHMEVEPIACGVDVREVLSK